MWVVILDHFILAGRDGSATLIVTAWCSFAIAVASLTWPAFSRWRVTIGFAAGSAVIDSILYPVFGAAFDWTFASAAAASSAGPSLPLLFTWGTRSFAAVVGISD